MNPLDQIDNVSDATQARALRDKFLAELAKPNLTDTRALNLEDAVDRLEADWPEIQGSEMEDAVERSERNRRRRERRATTKTTSRGRRRRPARAGGRSSGRMFGPRARGYARRTGLPAAATTATDIALSWIGGTIGLILLFLFIANRRGNLALQDTINGISKALSHFVSPVDPLSPTSGRFPNQVAANQANRAVSAGLRQHGVPFTRRNVFPNFPGGHRHQVGSHVGGG